MLFSEVFTVEVGQAKRNRGAHFCCSHLLLVVLLLLLLLLLFILIPSCCFRKVVVVDDDQINACALPGGKIVINSGLVRRFADDEPALAFVIAHEVGHVLARHSAEQLTLQGATQLVATVAQGVAMAAAAAAAASGQPGVQMPRGAFFSFFLSFFFFFP